MTKPYGLAPNKRNRRDQQRRGRADEKQDGAHLGSRRLFVFGVLFFSRSDLTGRTIKKSGHLGFLYFLRPAH
jgi:hypothetical protein